MKHLLIRTFNLTSVYCVVDLTEVEQFPEGLLKRVKSVVFSSEARWYGEDVEPWAEALLCELDWVILPEGCSIPSDPLESPENTSMEVTRDHVSWTCLLDEEDEEWTSTVLLLSDKLDRSRGTEVTQS